MGCFSSVCVVSKLPIYECPTVGIPISRVPHSPMGTIGGRRIACYPGTDWELDGFPIFGSDDSYGRIHDFEDGKYHKLTMARYKDVKVPEPNDRKDIKGFMSLINEWSQPRGNKSIMYIHRPVWNELMKRCRKLAAAVYKEEMDRAKEQDEMMAQTYKTAIKAKETEIAKTLKALRSASKIPYFRGYSLGISSDLVRWCNRNYAESMKDAIIDLIALSLSSIQTHTLFMPTYTVGEQISCWDFEACWHKFLAEFSGDVRKKLVAEGME